MMAQTIKYKPTVISRESTSAVLVTLSQIWSGKLASPPAVTPGHCQHGSVSLIMVTAREAANTPTGAAAGPHEPPAQRQNRDCVRDAFCCINVCAFLHKQTCKREEHEEPFRLNWMQPGMIRSGMNHAVLPHGVYDSDFTGAPKEESCCGGKGSGHAWFPQGNLAAEAAERLLVGKQSVAFAGLRFLRPKNREKKKKGLTDGCLYVVVSVSGEGCSPNLNH